MSVITYFSTHNHNLSTPSRILAMEYLIKNEVSATTFIDAIYFVEEKQKIVSSGSNLLLRINQINLMTLADNASFFQRTFLL